MLTEIINLRSLVASKARLNAALRRQHSRVANNQSEALPSQSPALPFSHGFPNSLKTVFLTQTDYFRIAVTGEQSRSLPTSRPLPMTSVEEAKRFQICRIEGGKGQSHSRKSFQLIQGTSLNQD